MPLVRPERNFCISQFKDLSELGRIGAKVMAMYFFTTIVAVTIGFSAFFLVKPGKFGMALSGTEATEEVALSNVSTSPRDTLIDIVPSNFIKPFLESNTLQIIFLAVIAGIVFRNSTAGTARTPPSGRGCRG